MYLIDTDTVVYALNGDPAAVRGFERAAAQPKAISVITLGELTYGALKSKRTHENLARVRRTGEILRVIDVSRAIVEVFAGLKADLETKSARLDDLDLLIGATALTYGYRLVTNNERHFRRIPGLEIENWIRG